MKRLAMLICGAAIFPLQAQDTTRESYTAARLDLTKPTVYLDYVRDADPQTMLLPFGITSPPR